MSAPNQFIGFAQMNELPSWMELVERVRWTSPVWRPKKRCKTIARRW
jgi:hypothetical protein